MSLPLSYLKVDKKSNDILVNLVPKLKVEAEVYLKTDFSQISKSTLYKKEITSIDAYDSPTEAKKLISTDTPSCSKCPEITYQTGSTASASQEVRNNYMNPVVVLKRLSFSGIDSRQSKQDSANTRSEDCQHSQEIR